MMWKMTHNNFNLGSRTDVQRGLSTRPSANNDAKGSQSSTHGIIGIARHSKLKFSLLLVSSISVTWPDNLNFWNYIGYFEILEMNWIFELQLTYSGAMILKMKNYISSQVVSYSLLSAITENAGITNLL